MLKSMVVKGEKIGKIYYEKKHKTKEIIQNVSFEINSNEIVGIMGPSGCGKTTFAKILAGIEMPTCGKLELFGIDCTKKVTKEIKQKIGFVYQDNNLLPWRSVEENLRFPLEIFGRKDEKENKARINEALEMVGLSQYRTCLPQELSGGMMQRANIARAMVTEPDLLIMDQPFGALDAITRKKMRFDFLNIFERTHKSIIIITNSIDEALLFSNRIYVMSDSPGTIEDIVEVDVPFEDRTADIAGNEKFTALRKQMISIVKRQYSQSGNESGEVTA